jgi:hypothetical protein
MKVSVVTTCQKGDPDLDRFKEALSKQTYKNFELIIIDEPCSIPEGRNKGIEKAKGELIVLTDTDCIPKENWLEELVQVTKQHGKGNIILGSTSRSFLNTSSVCLYRDDFVPFDVKFVIDEDTEWFSHLKSLGKKIIHTNDKGIVVHTHSRRTYKNQLKIAFLESYYCSKIHKMHGKNSVVSPYTFFLSYCFQLLVLIIRFLALFVGYIRWKVF